MSRLRKFHMAVFALLPAVGSMLVPLGGEAREIPWLLRIKALMTYHQEMAALQGLGHVYTPYFEQIDYMNWLFVGGEPTTTFKAMNTLTKMLQFDMEKKELPQWSAKDLYNFCEETTPSPLHDSGQPKDFSGYRA